MKENKEKLMEEVKKKVEKEKHNRIIISFFVVVGIIVVFFIAWNFLSTQSKTFEYRGVDFEITEEIAPYRTEILIDETDLTTGIVTQIPYGFYIRKDPRKLGEIPFEGNLELKKNMIIKSSAEFNCDGNGIIGIANLARLYNAMGIEIVNNNDVGCPENGEYMWLHIQEGNETKIEKVGTACYNMYVHNCEILEATEKLMVETFVRVNEVVEN